MTTNTAIKYLYDNKYICSYEIEINNEIYFLKMLFDEIESNNATNKSINYDLYNGIYEIIKNNFTSIITDNEYNNHMDSMIQILCYYNDIDNINQIPVNNDNIMNICIYSVFYDKYDIFVKYFNDTVVGFDFVITKIFEYERIKIAEYVCGKYCIEIANVPIKSTKMIDFYKSINVNFIKDTCLDTYNLDVIKYLHENTNINNDKEYFLKHLHNNPHCINVDIIKYLHNQINFDTSDFIKLFARCADLDLSTNDAIKYLYENNIITKENLENFIIKKIHHISQNYDNLCSNNKSISQDAINYICKTMNFTDFSYDILFHISMHGEIKDLHENNVINKSLCDLDFIQGLFKRKQYENVIYILDNIFKCLGENNESYITMVNEIFYNHIFYVKEPFIFDYIVKECKNIKIHKMLDYYIWTNNKLSEHILEKYESQIKPSKIKSIKCMNLIKKQKIDVNLIIKNNQKNLKCTDEIIYLVKNNIIDSDCLKNNLSYIVNNNIILLKFCINGSIISINDLQNINDVTNYESIKYLHEELLLKNDEWYNQITAWNIHIVKYLCEIVKLDDKVFKLNLNYLINNNIDGIISYLLSTISFSKNDFKNVLYYKNLKMLEYVHKNELADIKSDVIMSNLRIDLDIIKYLHKEVNFTKDDFRKENLIIIKKLCDDVPELEILFDIIKYLHMEVGFISNDFTHFIQYINNILNRSDESYPFYEQCLEIYFYCVEFFDIDRENININGKITMKILDEMKVMSSKVFKCVICLNNISGHDYMYSPKCCINYDRNICKDCGYNAIGVMDSKCLFCRKSLVN